MPVQFQDDVVSFLPHDPKHILLQYSRSDPGMPDVYKVPITKRARHKVIQRGKAGVGSWLADRDGEIRLGEGIKGLETPFLTIRLAGEKKWLDFSRRVNQKGIVFRPLAFASEPNELYVASNHEGDPTGLYLFDIEADEFSEAIFQHPTVDISSIYVDYDTGKLDHINFVEDSVKTKYFSRKPIEDDAAITVCGAGCQNCIYNQGWRPRSNSDSGCRLSRLLLSVRSQDAETQTIAGTIPGAQRQSPGHNICYKL